ncbi:MAG: hypothetical protein DRI24_24075 [Deltaproteobacteria bacterium]|nr:MAG: hypothetical protein DRI24_24075 [Deltaproteobacteria bacterium]
MALNKLLIALRDNYGLNLSFDDKELSKYNITLSKEFDSPEEALNFILKDLPVTYEKSGEVYLFYSKERPPEDIIIYRLAGKTVASEDLESLPFTHVIINGSGGITDEFGNFNFESKRDSIFRLKISHLGYQVLDTLLSHGLNHQIKLVSALLRIDEVVVRPDPTISQEQTGSEAGLMRLNHNIAILIPGNGDNSVFNLLRLQPGILAAGERSSDIIIWGSQAGQSQINFDGMTLFGLKNYNDNISAVNPFMAKDIRVHKGGFDATLGERVGAIVDITGIEGNKIKPGLNININNMTANILAEAPLRNNVSIVGAYRQTYYNLYSPEDLQIAQGGHDHFGEEGIIVSPAYKYRDGNLKLSGQTNEGDSYQVSAFLGQDQFAYSLEDDYMNMSISQELKEKNRQYGIRTQYNKLWKGLGTTEISVAYSSLQNKVSDIQNSTETGMGMGQWMHQQNRQTQNDISELKVKIAGNFTLYPGHTTKFGVGLIGNSTILKEITNNINQVDEKEQGTQLMSYLQDRIFLNSMMHFTVGLRADYSINIQKFYLQPRFKISIKPSSHFQFNGSWGLYNQFINLSSVVDDQENYRFVWMVSEGDQFPVLSSQHLVIGGIYRNNGFSFSIESFYKITKGITRILQSYGQNSPYEGMGKTKGIDFYVKQNFKGHSLWLSYTISQSLEWFPFFTDSEYQSSLHDQRHEIKLSGIVNLSPFFLSANYVYGSGFLGYPPSSIDSSVKYPYKRADLAVTYRFALKRVKIEAGISILNLFNRENIKFTDVTRIPVEGSNSVSIYSEALPFTPAIFLNLKF